MIESSRNRFRRGDYNDWVSRKAISRLRQAKASQHSRPTLLTKSETCQSRDGAPLLHNHTIDLHRGESTGLRNYGASGVGNAGGDHALEVYPPGGDDRD
ncbi:MAG TPA: hypothetical protein DC054_23345 [Blastocatellia bacterium]|nr:hypothetical protein [Blastocatellia bacterium]